MSKNPIAIRDAKKIAEAAAGRTLTYEQVWIEQAYGGAFDEFKVHYITPRTDGFFIANQSLVLTTDEWHEYSAWKEARD